MKLRSEIKFKKIGQLIIFLSLSFSLLFLSGGNVYKKELALEVEPSPLPSPLPNPVPYPLKSTENSPPTLTAKAVMAVDLKSGTILYAQNEDLPLWPASTIKLMTALVSLDKYKLDDVLTVKHPLQLGRIMNLVSEEKITVENLLYGLLVHSANDAAYTLAENYPEGLAGFLAAMNQKALTLNLENTHFTNPAGFDDNKQYTTAKDLVRLSLYALKNPLISKMVGTPAITVHDIDYFYFHPLTNVNSLLGKVPGVAGVKTGWSENAKENLVYLTKKKGQEVLIVVLGSQDRFGETQLLTNWVFNNYKWIEPTPPAKKGQ